MVSLIRGQPNQLPMSYVKKQLVPSWTGISARIAQAKETARQATGTANLTALERAFYNRLVELNQHPSQHV